MNIQDIRANLEKKGYAVSVFHNSQEIVEYLRDNIKGKTVGFGGSQTLTDLDLRHELSKENQVFVPDFPVEGHTFSDTARSAAMADVFLLSANAISENGEIVNIDGYGNRLAGSLFGHGQVYYIIGANKIGGTLEEAIHRARNIASPKNALRLHCKTPCAMSVVKKLTLQFNELYPDGNQLDWQRFIEGLSEEELGTHCYDCKSPGRICGSLLIHWKKPGSAAAEVIILEESKGF